MRCKREEKSHEIRDKYYSPSFCSVDATRSIHRHTTPFDANFIYFPVLCSFLSAFFISTNSGDGFFGDSAGRSFVLLFYLIRERERDGERESVREHCNYGIGCGTF